MGTHPIFESDFDCLTEYRNREMPKYYCDYCDTFLTHDSPSVRKTHNAGRKHKDNVRTFYQEWLDKQTASLMDRSRPMTGLPVVGQQQLRAGFSTPMMMNPMMSQMMGQMAGMRPGMMPQMQMRPMMQSMMRPMMGAPMMMQRPN